MPLYPDEWNSSWKKSEKKMKPHLIVKSEKNVYVLKHDWKFALVPKKKKIKIKIVLKNQNNCSSETFQLHK